MNSYFAEEAGPLLRSVPTGRYRYCAKAGPLLRGALQVNERP